MATFKLRLAREVKWEGGLHIDREGLPKIKRIPVRKIISLGRYSLRYQDPGPRNVHDPDPQHTLRKFDDINYGEWSFRCHAFFRSSKARNEKKFFSLADLY